MIKNKIPFVVVSHRREKLITIDNVLKDFSDVYIFVNDKTDKKLVEREYRKYKIVVSESENVAQQRNFIDKYFGDGTKVVELDDDIKHIGKLDNIGKNINPVNSIELLKFIDRGFELCEKHRTILWGVYPVPDAFYMEKNKISFCAFVIGSFTGLIIDNKIKIDDKIMFKDDYYRCGLVIEKYGKLVRFDDYTVNAIHYNKNGGISEFRNFEAEKRECELLIKRFPYLYRMNSRRENQILMRNLYV